MSLSRANKFWYFLKICCKFFNEQSSEIKVFTDFYRKDSKLFLASWASPHRAHSTLPKWVYILYIYYFISLLVKWKIIHISLRLNQDYFRGTPLGKRLPRCFAGRPVDGSLTGHRRRFQRFYPKHQGKTTNFEQNFTIFATF